MAIMLKLFLSSPSDMSEEREIVERVVQELNELWGSRLGILFELLRWETIAVPGFGDDPQDVINESIPDDYQLFIGLMWTRFGTPTGRFGSGTEEEFYQAYNRWKDDRNAVRIMFYFKNSPIPPFSLDADQLADVKNFKRTLGDLGGLYWTFETPNDFESDVRRHLTRFIQDYRAPKVGTMLDPIPIGSDLPENLTAHPAPSEPPLPPHVFVGVASIGGSPVRDGTVVSAWIEGIEMGSTKALEGKFTLVVAGASSNAQQNIAFMIGELEARESGVWQQGGAEELNLSARPISRVPPHVFVGTASIDGLSVADGTTIAAIIMERTVASTVTTGGIYVLLVDQGDSPLSGETIHFKVGGFDAKEGSIWQQGGGSELDLTAKQA